MKHRLLYFFQVAFWPGQEEMPGDELKHRFLEVTQFVICYGEEAENDFKVTCEPLQYRFPDITQVAFWAVQEVENVFAVLCNHLNHRFLGLTQVAFLEGQ